MRRSTLIVPATITLMALALAGCAVQPSSPGLGDPTASPSTPAAADLARTDVQGAVEFVVTPLNLTAPNATLDFKVSMNTHSIDLGWDLAAQSTLSTNGGAEVAGQAWPVGSGHHYDGTLSFPVFTADGRALLDGATTLILTIQDTDVAERVFTWELGP